jgi:hypothetical protein
VCLPQNGVFIMKIGITRSLVWSARRVACSISVVTLAAVFAVACQSTHSRPPPPAAALDPRVARDDALARLRASGPAGAAALDAQRALKTASDHLPQGVSLRAGVGEAECWAAGCAAEARVPFGRDAHARQADLMRALKKEWSGPVLVSGLLATNEGDMSCTAFIQAPSQSPSNPTSNHSEK